MFCRVDFFTMGEVQLPDTASLDMKVRREGEEREVDKRKENI